MVPETEATLGERLLGRRSEVLRDRALADEHADGAGDEEGGTGEEHMLRPCVPYHLVR